MKLLSPTDWIAKNFLVLLARFISGATVRWLDSQPDTCQRVYFANHTSHLDSIVIWASLPPFVRERTRMIAAKDYWNAGPIRRYISKRLFNALLIDREKIGIKNTPIKMMIDEMQDTFSVVLFPEGGRSSNGVIGEFKSGLYHLCKKRPDLELIPVYLDNMNRILPRGKTLPVPMLSRVIFGPPLWLEEKEPKEAFLERARLAVINLKDK
ncbi:MAG: lysophospholipid acyltransferase family protein [Thermoguttaceae bacterium]